MSNPTSFVWEPDPLVLNVDYVVDPSMTSSNLYLSSPPPHVHYTTGLNGPWAEQIYGCLPQSVQILQPIRLPCLLVYKHKVDPNAPLGSFENPYSSFNAPPLPRLHSSNSSFSDPVRVLESELTNAFDSLEPRPPTPPKRSRRRYSDHKQEHDACPIEFEPLRPNPPPEPANQPRNTRPISSSRNRSCSPPDLRLRPQPLGISIPHRPPPVHHRTRHVRFAASNRTLSPSSSWSTSLAPPSTSGSPPPSFTRSPSRPPLRHCSPPPVHFRTRRVRFATSNRALPPSSSWSTSPTPPSFTRSPSRSPLRHRSSPPVHHTRRVHFAPSNRTLSPSSSWSSSPTPPSSTSGSPPPCQNRSPSRPPLRHRSPLSLQPRSSPSRSSTSYTVRSYQWPLCTLCATKPATIDDEGMRFCRTCWEEATDAEGKMRRGRWWRDA